MTLSCSCPAGARAPYAVFHRTPRAGRRCRRTPCVVQALPAARVQRIPRSSGLFEARPPAPVGEPSKILQQGDLELRAAPEAFEVGLQGHADVELQEGLPRTHGVPRDPESREPVEVLRGEAVADVGVIEGGLETNDVGEVEGILRAPDPPLVVAHARPGEPAHAISEEGELELAEPVEARAVLPDRLEAKFLEQRQEHLLGDAVLVRLVVLLGGIELSQTGPGRRTGERVVAPRLPCAAIVLLRGRAHRPGGPVELPRETR